MRAVEEGSSRDGDESRGTGEDEGRGRPEAEFGSMAVRSRRNVRRGGGRRESR